MVSVCPGIVMSDNEAHLARSNLRSTKKGQESGVPSRQSRCLVVHSSKCLMCAWLLARHMRMTSLLKKLKVSGSLSQHRRYRGSHQRISGARHMRNTNIRSRLQRKRVSICELRETRFHLLAEGCPLVATPSDQTRNQKSRKTRCK